MRLAAHFATAGSRSDPDVRIAAPSAAGLQLPPNASAA